jgi:hypothetical protein
MNVVIQLLNNKEVSQQVKKKILQLIQLWGLRFEEDSDVLPLFTSIYGALKQRNLPFPSEAEAKQQVRKIKDAVEGKGPMPSSKPLDKKHAKLRKDLEVVIENVVLTNEMIDAHDPDEEVDENDALLALAQTLRTFENKILEIIEKIKNDEVMNLALLVNDDLQKTLKRYRRVEHGRVPDKFKPECRKYLPGYSETPEKEKNKSQKKNIHVPEKVQQVETQPEPIGRSKPANDNDIFGFSQESSDPQSSTSSTMKPSDDDGLFGLDFDAPSQPPTQAAIDSNISKLNEIMEKMNLEKQKKEQANVFATAGPGMGGGFGMGVPPMGGPPMGGGNFGPNPGMFHTGMPQHNMYGGGPIGPGPVPGLGVFPVGFAQPPSGGNFGGGFGGGGNFGGAGNFAGSSGFGGGNDLFGGGLGNDVGSNLFQTAPTHVNYNPGGGPEAFKNVKKAKKVEKGPKEFGDLFSMASKITDRTNQPTSSVDEYVTSYKNNYSGMRENQDNDGVNDLFAGGGSSQQTPQNNAEDDFFRSGNSNTGNQANDDPFGGIDNTFGGSGRDQTDQIFNGSNNQNQPYNPPQNNAFVPAPPQNQGSNMQGDMFGGSSQPANDDKNKQEELFDIFG